ncbi:TPA: hypothetical protein U1274_001503 [Streptococcus suis]|nr:hypothetical protein [Streptococcus suis]HEM5182257.1 hypothetical protein [Streptococcus suis]HEM6222121.1 hypothetical protein [Streptococcus suis]
MNKRIKKKKAKQEELRRQKELEQLIRWLNENDISFEQIAQNVAICCAQVIDGVITFAEGVGRLVNSIDCSRIGHEEDDRESREHS